MFGKILKLIVNLNAMGRRSVKGGAGMYRRGVPVAS
jgi:hypothetical protein